jgi:uncharacterized SAM-binding protein YcdF (DUF218 family)
MLGELRWQDLVEALLLPPGCFVFLFILGGLVGQRWSRLGWGLLALAGTALYLLSTAYVSRSLSAAVEAPPAALDLDALRGAPNTAIVVLSGDLRWDAAEYGGDTVGAVTLERMRYAARLQRATRLPMLASGGVLRARAPLAQAMKDGFERDFNVPVRWTETRSETTWENALFSAEMLKKDGITRIVLVTHAIHMPRALMAFRGTGLEVIPAATLHTYPIPLTLESLVPRIVSLDRSYDALHEAVGLLWYRILPRPILRTR